LKRVVFFVVPFLALLQGFASGETFDAASGFPNSPALPAESGAWSYGYSNTLGGTFTSHSNSTTDYFGNQGGIVGFYTPLSTSAQMLPVVLKNTTGSTYNISTIQGWSPDLLLLHPGESPAQGEFSVVRFTAPAAGVYDISAHFMGLDITPTTTDVHVLLNDTDDLFDALINSHLVDTLYTGSPLTLSEGDHIDFAVGFQGSLDDTNFFADSTGFDATIVSETPEPGTVALFGGGLVLIAGMRRKTARGK
jgi:hypothetical protein